MSDEVLERISLLCQLSKSQLDALEEMLARQPSEGNSSVQIATSTRGHDITVKCYVGSDVRPAADQAMDEWLRIRDEMEQRLMGKAA